MTKRLIQVNSVSNYGSTGRIMEAIGLLAKSEGWDSTIATGSRYSKTSQLPSYTISSIWQNRFSAAHSFLTGRHGFANERETSRFISWMKDQHPDIVHLHNIHSYYVNVPLLFDYLLTSEVPVVWTLHDCWPFTGHCSHFVTVNCERWKTGCYECPQIHKFPTSLFFDQSSSNYQDKKRMFTGLKSLRIVTVSEWLGEMTKRSFLGQYPVEVIPNGVDLKLFRPRDSSYREKYGLMNKKVLLGVSTAWCTAKGLEDYVKLRQALPRDLFEIVLVGMNKHLIPSYSEKGLVCVERTSDINPLVEWYNTADVVLNLSYAETFGLPVAEGYACGKPAVVYDNTALSELIETNTGERVETGNIQQLASAIETIVNSPESYSGNACRERAMRFYDRDRNFRRYLDLYERLLR